MSKLFEQGQFVEYARYGRSNLTGARQDIRVSSIYGIQTTVFISHKHDELDDLSGVLGFLQEKYRVKVYIDSQDPTMPRDTSAETAINLKLRIKNCDKFILLATNGAIESKWCNWELGYGDAQKYEKHIALFPMKPKNSQDSAYKGAEYLSIYPYIRYSNGTDRNEYGEFIQKGYYVVRSRGGKVTYTELSKWFSQR